MFLFGNDDGDFKNAVYYIIDGNILLKTFLQKTSMNIIKTLIIGLAVVTVAFTQITNYLDNTATIECSPVIIIAPEIKSEMLGGDFESEELINASNMLSNAVAEKYGDSKIIQPNDLPKISDCSSNIVVIRVKNYFKEPARLGQFRGNITIEILFFPSPLHKKPANEYEFSAKGGVHWGDSTPFFNALESVLRKIRRNYKTL